MKLTFDEAQDVIKMWAVRCQKLRNYFDAYGGEDGLRAMWLLVQMSGRCKSLILKSHDAIGCLTNKRTPSQIGMIEDKVI